MATILRPKFKTAPDRVNLGLDKLIGLCHTTDELLEEVKYLNIKKMWDDLMDKSSKLPPK